MQKYEQAFNLIPVCKEIFADIITPINLLRKLAQVDKNYYLLESVEGGERWGRYSFLGFNPLMHITCKNGEVTVKSGEIITKTVDDPMKVLRGLLDKYKAPHIDGMPPFTGGFVGYFSYEMIGYAEPKLKIKKNDFQDYDLMLFDKVIAFDHLRQKISIVANYKSEDSEQGFHAALLEIEKIIHLINDPAPLQVLHADSTPDFTCNISKDEYCQEEEACGGGRTIKSIHESD